MPRIKAKKGVIIARVSTKKQAGEDRYSLPTQLERIRDYASKNEIEILEEFALAESAFKGKRKRFKNAIARAFELAYFEPLAIMFFEEDRVTRKAVSDVMVELEQAREKGKIELHFVLDNKAIHKNSPPGDTLIFRIKCDVAEHESAIRSRKVKETIRSKLSQGLYPGGMTHTGYLNRSVDMGNGVLKKEIIADPERAPFIEKCFRLYASDKYSGKQIANILRKENFTMKTGKPPTEQDVYGILRDPFYTGKFYYRNPDTGERQLYSANGSYPELVDKVLFEKVQDLLDKNNSRSKGYEKNNFKFRGLITCGFCGCVLTPEEMSRTYKDKNSKQAQDSIYYHCTSGRTYEDPDWYRKEFGEKHSGVYVSKKGKDKGKTKYACPQKWWKESEIEEFILSKFEDMNYGEEMFDWFREVLKTDYEERVEIVKAQIISSRKELNRNEKVIGALVQNIAMETDVDLRADMKKEYTSLKEKQESLKEELEGLEAALESDTDETVSKLVFCCNLLDQYKRLDPERKRDLLSSVFIDVSAMRGECRREKKGEIEKFDYLDVEWAEPFATLFEINFEELYDQWAEGQNLTKENSMEASLFP